MMLEKYRHKARCAIAIAFDQMSARLVEFALHLEGKWEHDPEIEADLCTSPAPHAYDGRKRVRLSPNDPCMCGSGKKFKKCCMGK